MGRTAEATSTHEHAQATSPSPPASGKRSVIPWREIEQRLAERFAASAVETEREFPASKPWTHDSAKVPAPSSGVRSRDHVDEPVRGLTYSVYTVADLEARSQARKRASRALLPARPSGWADVKMSVLNLLRAFWRGWMRAKQRPRLLDVCTVPFHQLVTDTKTALRGVPWSKVAMLAAAALGATLALLVAILTMAELTDDLKPARSTLASRADEPAPVAESTPPPVVTASDLDPAPTPTPTIEIDDAPVAKVASRPATKSKKPVTPTPPSDEIFTP